MATTFAAMRARLGDTEYYVLSMKAQDLVNRTKNGTASSNLCVRGWSRGCPSGIAWKHRTWGFLRFRGGELLVPLDGRHRLKAVEFALNGRDERNRPLPNARPCAQLAQDDVTVILVPYEDKEGAQDLHPHDGTPRNGT